MQLATMPHAPITQATREALRAALGLHRQTSAIHKCFYEPVYKAQAHLKKKRMQPKSKELFEIRSFLQVKLDEDPDKCVVLVEWEPLPHENGKCDVSLESIWNIAKDLKCQGELFEGLKDMIGKLPMPVGLMDNMRGTTHYYVARKVLLSQQDKELRMAAKQLVDMWSYYSM
jgi:hypothetical protein